MDELVIALDGPSGVGKSSTAKLVAQKLRLAVPEVRRVLTERMRRIIAEHDRRMVVEGRDITTVVAPDAEVRVLLTADAAARIGRRAAELGERADQVTVTDSILRRDRDDSTVSNFTEAADGVSVVDSTHLGLDEVVAEILKLVPDA